MTNQIQEAFPYLRVRNAVEAIEFYKAAFGAVEDFRLSEPGGRVGHAELKFGPYTVMVSNEYPEYGIRGPESGRPTGSAIHLHVDDVDALTEQAVSAGATLTMAPADQFHGERSRSTSAFTRLLWGSWRSRANYQGTHVPKVLSSFHLTSRCR